jgi:hypothetical protein
MPHPEFSSLSNSNAPAPELPNHSAPANDDEWAARFLACHGRTPRVLHIGNIANNAYLNARILNDVSLDCDVLCNDYYHIMGYPEWEDADFTDGPVSQNRPNWCGVDLGDYTRPRWFAQGPFDFAALYLIARRDQRPVLQTVLWNILMSQCHLGLRSGQAKAKQLVGLFWTCVRLVLRCILIGSHIEIWKKSPVQRSRLKSLLVPPLKVLFSPIWLLNLLVARALTGLVLCRPPIGSRQFLSCWLHRLVTGGRGQVAVDRYQRRLTDLQTQFSQLFPERDDQLNKSDFVSVSGTIPLLDELLSRYDLVHAYATSPILPMVCSKQPYLAYEHGTIRQIPFEADRVGRMTALAYRLADGVVITNCDNREAAERLRIGDYRFVPHPVREQHLVLGAGRDVRRELLEEMDANFLVFHPARHDWSEDSSADIKGNHQLIDALCRFFTEVAPRAAAIFVEWGGSVAASKQRIARHGCQDRFRWLAPVGGMRMAKLIDACDVTADQFHLGAFGAIVPKGLAMGKGVVCYVEPEMHRWCFDELPPVVNARSAVEIFDALKRIYTDVSYRAKLTEQGTSWYHKYHSETVVRARLARFYADLWCRDFPPGQGD